MSAPSTSQSARKIEFAVQMTCDACVTKVQSALATLGGIKSTNISLSLQQVTVETELPVHVVEDALKTTGLRVTVRGQGSIAGAGLGAAVCILSGEASGVIRFVQVSHDDVVIDGTVDGLSPGLHGFHIHEFGDLSQGCISTGGHFNPFSKTHGAPSDVERHAGDLGNIQADSDGRASFVIHDSVVKVWDIIGRAVVVHAAEDDLGNGGHETSKTTGNAGPRVACGIIARSAGLFENTKKYCACDGRTLWDEADRAAASLAKQPSNL